ncbi:hypothetical protein INT80_00820 [Gallibacterium anatis]|uniref:Uncharacterized protein n=1 Tax=Gallibacterium anatis TaxID=750 RepID=A0A930UVX3_9PAST|nr:hypothetical protein [Gallibacterium anatis]
MRTTRYSTHHEYPTKSTRTIQSQHNLTITAPNLTNQQKGKLLALEQLSITSQQLDNQTGLIQANQ